MLARQPVQRPAANSHNHGVVRRRVHMVRCSTGAARSNAEGATPLWRQFREACQKSRGIKK